ncbi:MAG: formate dehydrogenase subunit alpha [Spirochaetae bacterium HGW-Spirochaetae-3]|jgi:formate dehydrogenase alpha subunit|nr:MAG: formate dehydrogenase subunit alpha [Spirochaetae bacterium HGW-Spirochaetae-3]
MMANDRIRVTIDGEAVSAEPGMILLEVARGAGFDVPSLCWHRKLSPTGACRLCIVKVEGMRGLVTSCSTRVEDGMNVTAFDDELEEERRFILASLMTETGFGTDGSHRDEFAELCVRYGLADAVAPPRPPAETMGLPLTSTGPCRVDDSSPVLSFDPSKCVKCFRCVRACDEVQGKGVIGVMERGIHSYIAAGMDGWGGSECDGCGECVQLCPTGALVERPNRAAIAGAGLYSSPPDARSKVRTTCAYCGVGCQLSLTVLDGRIVRADGVEGVLPNDGRLCVKGRFGYDFVDSAERLTAPLIREGGAFREASWDEALDAAAAGFLSIKERYGPDALAGYSSAKCTNEENYLFQKFVRVAFGTNNLDYCTRLCHASTVTAMLKALGDGAATNSIEDYESVGCALVIGNNMIETHPVTATYLKRGLSRGGRLVVVDPRWTPLANLADVWLQPRLGTDVALLNGMARIAIEEGWIDKDFIARRVSGGLESLETLKRAVEPYDRAEVERICGVPGDPLLEATRLYATADSSIIATGMGMSQQSIGTNNVFALINLMLVTGQVGREGAGISPPRGQNNVQGATDVGASPIFYPGYVPASDLANRTRVAALWGYPVAELPGAKGLSTVEIMHAAGEGGIRGLYVMGENPLHTDPNLNHVEESVRALDFLVVQDIFMTPTAMRADVVLPAACFAEKDGTFTNSDRRVLRVREAVTAPGLARDDAWIIQEIARRMRRPIGPYGSSAPYPSASSIWDEIAAAAPIVAGVSYGRLESGGIQWPCPDSKSPGQRTLFLERFNTPDGLARITPVAYASGAEETDGEYPLLLNTGRILYQYHSSTMSLRSAPLSAYAKDSYILVHTDDALRYGLTDGSRVRVRSRRGELKTTLRVDDGVTPGECFMPFHFPDALVNRLTRDVLDPSSRIAPLKLSAVRVEPA